MTRVKCGASMGTERERLILVVDDDEVELEMVGQMLADAGYPTVLSSDGSSAVDDIRRKRPALVILDLRMADPDTGWQILTMLRADPQMADLPVILYSADQQFLRMRARILRTRKNCTTLEKPFEIADLLAKVAAAIGPA